MKNLAGFLAFQSVFLCLAYTIVAQEKPTKKPSIEKNAKAFTVRLPLTVTDAQKKQINCRDNKATKDKKAEPNPLVKCFKKNDFAVFEDGVRQKIRSFTIEKSESPIYVGVLMDTSTPDAKKLMFSKRAASDFLYTIVRLRKDKAAFMTFDNQTTILLQDFTDKLDLLDRAVDRVKKGGINAALYDALWRLIDERLRSAPGKRVLVFISNGADASRLAKLDDVIGIARRTGTTIFGIFTEEPRDKRSARLCEETGGEAFFPSDMAELERAFSSIGKDLRSPYVITYRPKNRSYDGRKRKIEVRFKKKSNAGNYRILSKTDYRAR